MFDWFWEFLYGLSKSIFRLIDGLMMCANKLCGIDPITVDGEDVSFLNYLLVNDRILFAFKVAALMGLILVVVFAVAAIIRSIVSEKAGTTPARVCLQTAKTMFMFMLIPVCMVLLVHFVNIFMTSLYSATLGGSSDGLGRYLCGAFAQDGLRPGVDPDFYLAKDFDYTDTEMVSIYVSLNGFDYLFSWLSGACILVSLASCLLMFVDRAISIAVLFVVSPISLSTNVIDDGAHFKLWRDQVLVKFLTGYGCILGLNVYTLIITIIANPSVVFFEDSSFLNFLLKIAFITGGAVSMQRIMALVGNLVSSGAGSNELRDNAIANAGFAGIAGKAAGIAGGILKSPFSAIRSGVNFAKDAKNYGTGSTIASRMGFKTAKDYGVRSKSQLDQDKKVFEERQASKNESKKKLNDSLAKKIGDRVAEAIAGKKSGVNDVNENGRPRSNSMNNLKTAMSLSPLETKSEKK